MLAGYMSNVSATNVHPIYRAMVNLAFVGFWERGMAQWPPIDAAVNSITGQ